MEERIVKSEDITLNSAKKSATDFYSIGKQAVKQNLTVPNPYVHLERMVDLNIPNKKQTQIKKKLPIYNEIEEEESESSKESENSFSLSDQESEFSNYLSEESANENETTKQTRKNKKAKANSEMSEYEKQIQQNLEERKKMFQDIVGGAKWDFMCEINKEKKIKASVRQERKRKTIQSVEVLSLSMSLRVSNRTLPISYREEVESGSSSDQSKVSKKFSKTKKNKKKEQKKIVDLFTLADSKLKNKSIEDREFFKKMIPLLEKESESKNLPADHKDFLKLMKSFSICEKGVAKISKTQINCIAWHPSNYKLLVAVGSRDGNIGFWDVDNLKDKYQGVRECNRVHKKSINCITFDAFNSMRLLSSSHDGCVQYLDLHSNALYKIYWNDLKNTPIYCHAQKNPSTLILSQSNGNVLVIDLRTASYRVENTIQCFENGTGTISLHPQDQNLFMTCDRLGEMAIFDMRYTAANDSAVPVVSFPKAPKRVNGAFFSPISGRYALTTCADDTIKLYDVQKGKSEPECIKSIAHSNKPEGSKLTPLKAVWHPQRDDVFIVGSMEYPYRVELYGAPSGTLLHDFNGDFLESVTTINVFHPKVPIFAACNMSEVHIFRS